MILSPEVMKESSDRFGKLALKVVQACEFALSNPPLYEMGRLTAHEDLDAIFDLLTNEARRAHGILNPDKPA